MRHVQFAALFVFIVFGFSELSHAGLAGRRPPGETLPNFKKMECLDLKIPAQQMESIKTTDDLVNRYLQSTDESCAMTYALEIKNRIFSHPGDENYFLELIKLKNFFNSNLVEGQEDKITDLVYFLQDYYFSLNMSYFGDTYSTWNNNKTRLRAASLIIVYAVIIANRKKLPTFLQNNVFDAKKLVINYILRVSAMNSSIEKQSDSTENSLINSVITDETTFYISPMEILKDELGWSKYFYQDPLTYADHQYEVNFASSLTVLFGSILVEEGVAFGTGAVMTAIGFAETGAAISGTVATVAAFAAAYVISYYAQPYFDQARIDSYYVKINRLKGKITSAGSSYEAQYYARQAMKQSAELYGIIYSRLWADYSKEIDDYTRIRSACMAMTIPSVHVKPYPIDGRSCTGGADEPDICKMNSLLMGVEPARLEGAKVEFAKTLEYYEQENSKFIDPLIKMMNEMRALSNPRVIPEVLQTAFSELGVYTQTLEVSRNTEMLASEAITQAQPTYDAVFQVKQDKDYIGYKKLVEQVGCISPYEDREFGPYLQ